MCHTVAAGDLKSGDAVEPIMSSLRHYVNNWLPSFRLKSAGNENLTSGYTFLAVLDLCPSALFVLSKRAQA